MDESRIARLKYEQRLFKSFLIIIQLRIIPNKDGWHYVEMFLNKTMQT
jgi:hypothetical protein